MMAAPLPAIQQPLFAWREDQEIARLAEKRTGLIRRIALLPCRSHRRVELEAELRSVTARQLELENTHGTIARETGQ